MRPRLTKYTTNKHNLSFTSKHLLAKTSKGEILFNDFNLKQTIYKLSHNTTAKLTTHIITNRRPWENNNFAVMEFADSSTVVHSLATTRSQYFFFDFPSEHRN